MASYYTFMGKGLIQNEPPWGDAYVFGADLNDVDTEGWEIPPDIWDDTTSFDLSTITINHEVVVALCHIYDMPEGVSCIKFVWHDSSEKKLFNYQFCFDSGEGGWMWAYSYIGWVVGEITANGDYHVHITVTGACSYSETIVFTVSGIPAGEGIPGHLWVESTDVHYIDIIGVRRYFTAYKYSLVGSPGALWAEDTYLCYLDADGYEHHQTGTEVGGVGAEHAGSIWVEGNNLHYVDQWGMERYWAGATV